MIGIGAEEIFLIITCCAFPTFVASVTLLVMVNRKKLPPRDRAAEDDANPR